MEVPAAMPHGATGAGKKPRDPMSTLASFACHADSSKGRRFPELIAPTRTEFQRDRDRIVHSTAFRRLVYKTQVFLNHEGDLFRTRLTHSLEVAQLGRSIARNLGLNEDLVEAIALAHDLGHTPFGHAGQDALHKCLKESDPSSSGFEHNFQSLRVVDQLEDCYPTYAGLNLTFETREGVLKHCSRRNAQRIEDREPAGIAQRFLKGIAFGSTVLSPSLEAQLTNLADEIAYNAHDIDDGIRSGLLKIDDLEEIELFCNYLRESLKEHPQLTSKKRLFDTLRRMLSAQVYNVTDTSRLQVLRAQPADVEAVRRMPALISFSESMAHQSRQMKLFLLNKLYRHPQVMETAENAKRVICDLFESYRNAPRQMLWSTLNTNDLTYHANDAHMSNRLIADYIAGMTDRFAIKEHTRLTGRVMFPG